MTSTQKQMMIGCIATNLVAGNLFLLSGVGTTNYTLMISTSIACVLCFVFLFVKIRPATHNPLLLWLLSLITCVTITIFGNTIEGFRYSGVESISDFFQSILTGIFMGLIGSMIIYPIILIMSTINFVWLLLFVKSPLWEK